MIKGIVILLLMLLGFIPVLLGQQEPSGNPQDGIMLQQIEVDEHLLELHSNQDFSLQPVNFKDIMEQLRSRVASAEQENHVQITQNGNDNTAELTQQGIRNATEITQQGNANTYKGTLQGEDNLLHVVQSGNDNKVEQTLAGDNMELQLIQQGSSNELIQIETSGNAPNYQIHQKGEGMKIIIEHGIASFPYGN